MKTLKEVSETKILFHWIGLKKLAYKQANYIIVHYVLRYHGGGGGWFWNLPPRPTYIR